MLRILYWLFISIIRSNDEHHDETTCLTLTNDQSITSSSPDAAAYFH